MNSNTKHLPHATCHYGGEFLRSAFAQAGHAHRCEALMAEAAKLQEQHREACQPIVNLVDDLSDGLFLDLNMTYEVTPLGAFDLVDDMLERLRAIYGAEVGLRISCYGGSVERSVWTKLDGADWSGVESSLKSPHAIVVVWCANTGLHYPMLVSVRHRGE